MPGRIIKQKREELNISQAEMAERLHMSQSNYSKIENNRIDLRAKTAKEIAAILQLSLEELLPDDAIVESKILHDEKARVGTNEYLQHQLDEIKKMLHSIYTKLNIPL